MSINGHPPVSRLSDGAYTQTTEFITCRFFVISPPENPSDVRVYMCAARDKLCAETVNAIAVCAYV